MSSGDIDDTLASIEEYNQALQNPEFSAYISGIDQLPINREYDIPFGAGISRDGRTRYIDRNIHTRFRGADISSVLATHESWEWAARRWLGIGMDYQRDPSGHRLANRAELHALMQRVSSPVGGEAELWRAYDNFVDPQVKRDESESIKKVPPDLDLYPYVGTPTEKTLVDHGARATDSSPAAGAAGNVAAGKRPRPGPTSTVRSGAGPKQPRPSGPRKPGTGGKV